MLAIYTLLAASCVGDNGLVEAFEPNPKALERLTEENIYYSYITRLSSGSGYSQNFGGRVRTRAWYLLFSSLLNEDSCSRIAACVR